MSIPSGLFLATYLNFYFNIDHYLTFKRIFKCKEIEELTEKITNDMLNMYMCIFDVYFQPKNHYKAESSLQ